jgi:hypothetical protein
MDEVTTRHRRVLRALRSVTSIVHERIENSHEAPP